jgi:hypothetical protein
MLPPEWKQEIQEAIDETARRGQQNDQRREEIQKRLADGIQAAANALDSYNSKEAADEPRKRNRENLTIVALGAAAIFTLALDILSGCQLREMQKVYVPLNAQATVLKDQLRDIEIEQRPWVSFTKPELISDLIVDSKSGARMTIGATMQNTGHLPGENVSPFVDYYVSGYGGARSGIPSEVRTAFCREKAKAPLVTNLIGRIEFNGYVLFPGDKMPFEQVLTIAPDIISDARSKNTARDLFVWVIVCINYKIILHENDRHQTSHIFTIHGTDRGVPLGEDGVIPKGQLVVSWHQFGTLAN